MMKIYKLSKNTNILARKERWELETTNKDWYFTDAHIRHTYPELLDRELGWGITIDGYQTDMVCRAKDCILVSEE